MEGLDYGSDSKIQMPKGHGSQDPKDFDKCPYSKMGGKLPESASKPQKEDNKDSDSEDDAPQGGCPVMTNGKQALVRQK